MKKALQASLYLLILLASAVTGFAQGMKMGEVIIISNSGFKKEINPEIIRQLNNNKTGTSMELFQADRGERKGEFLLVSRISRVGDRNTIGSPFNVKSLSELLNKPGAYTEKFKSLPFAGIMGIHYLKVKEGRKKDFEKFVIEKLNPAVGNLLPDMQLLYYKAVAGEDAGSYITIYTIESDAARHKYWPAGAPETEILKKAFLPLKELAAELGTYLIEDSYLKPESGAAAYFESLKWTDYVYLENIPEGFVSLFNEKDFSNWKLPEGDNGHWKIINKVIDYDAESEAKTDKSLWTVQAYKNFILYVDWRIKATPWKNPNVPLILPSGLHKLDENGKEITLLVPDSDSGIMLRGTGKCQANIWCWPIGSGEVYGYRMDKNMPPDVRRGVTPKVNADKNIGEWNRFKITMKDDRLTVELNGITVIENALLPAIPEKGAIGLQHHGSKKDGDWVSPPSLVQFRRILIKEL
jgi:3-keto-disaccharide hydrolase